MLKFKSRLLKGALHSPQFRWFYLGQSVSLFGSGMTPLVLAFAVLDTPHGRNLLGYILAAEILPHVLMVLVGGGVADRYRRDRLMVLSNLGSGFSQAVIALIVLMGFNPRWILLFALISGVMSAFTSPAMRGIVPEVVSREDIRQANALLNTSKSAAKIVGPAVAGVLVATLNGGWAILWDAVSFFIASFTLSRVRIPSHPPDTGTSILQDMRAGWSYFRSRRWIWSITAAFAFMNAVQMGVWRVLGPIIAKNTFGSSGWGLTLSARSIGLLIASLFMLRLSLRYPLRASMMAVAVGGIQMIVLGQEYALPYLIIAAALGGVGSTISGIGWDATLQQAVPKDKLSRVCSFDDFGSYITIPIGVSLAVPLAQTFGYQTIATAGGVIFIVAALLPLAEPLVRNMRSQDLSSMRASIDDNS
ncbi:MFS transporter [Alicyclobacillus sp. SO9]|uniref:MFS transporter n=1 Tax=Alicyclobacillus sp. SO9 TaxID=2665646 RepID=UPI0018E71363|nr:MFS transporter [Alicyclobacillus sp. SO9]QQE77103.1 MFS transporter [Alicyclobacillus sp. SO9]